MKRVAKATLFCFLYIMRKIITSFQMREADQYTISHEPVSSIDLMERAAIAFIGVFCELVPDKHTAILVCCGTGNNGGDGLAIARLLDDRGYRHIRVLVLRFSKSESPDFLKNLKRLKSSAVAVKEISQAIETGAMDEKVVIDAMLGSGLNKPLEGEWAKFVEQLNGRRSRVIAVDIPTGLQANGQIQASDNILVAETTISFQRPKLSFFFPESSPFLKNFYEANIGLDESFIQSLPSVYQLVEPVDVRTIFKKRLPFSHKGTYGHALIIAGNKGTLGAAILCSGASLYAGAGLTTTLVKEGTATVTLNQRYPEVMTTSGSEFSENWNRWTAIAIGPGLGEGPDSILPSLLAEKNSSQGFNIPKNKALVIDADGLNYLSKNKKVLDNLAPGTILTPHMKEFDRLFGNHASWWDRVQTAWKEASNRKLVIVLKNQYTFIALPDGRILINTTGNPAMASGGMGDVLTGIITSFRAQGYSAEEAATLGCYLHGRAGDRLYHKGMAIVPASKLIEEIPFAIGELG
ncbi:NAD(P)H-hydrate epimerase [bacterium A37T11]|nr:NAD(P)H-hydrate epimerase [bacterium A37T11]